VHEHAGQVAVHGRRDSIAQAKRGGADEHGAAANAIGARSPASMAG
jgi:hypothetical protein